MTLTLQDKEEFAAIFGYGKIAELVSIDIEHPDVGTVVTITTGAREGTVEGFQPLSGHPAKVLRTAYVRSLLRTPEGEPEAWIEEHQLVRLTTAAEDAAIEAFHAKHAAPDTAIDDNIATH